MAYNHKDNISELVNNAGIPELDTFDYSNSDPYKVVELYFQFCQQNLSENSGDGIQPARIYIRRSMDVNAAASKVKDYYIMRVNFGTIVTMFRLYTDNRKLFESEGLKDFKELHEKLEASLDYLLFQISIQFTFYHEKAHLIQESPLHDTWLEESYQFDEPEKEPFDLKRQVYEFDADLEASTMVSFHLIDYWKRQKEEIRTEKNLELIVSIGLAGILSYFIYLMKRYDKVYYDASTHPHPLVRISYILDNMVKTIEHNLERPGIINSEEIIRNAFKIADSLFSSSGRPWVKNFVDIFFKEQKSVESFVNNTLIKTAEGMPELVMNRNKR